MEWNECSQSELTIKVVVVVDDVDCLGDERVNVSVHESDWSSLMVSRMRSSATYHRIR